MAELGRSLTDANQVIKDLKENLWLDRQSRAIWAEFNLYNANTNLFTAVTLLLELPATGSAMPNPVIKTLQLYNYIGGRAIFRLILELSFVAFTIYYMVREGKKIKKAGRHYFGSFWNIIELVNLGLSVTACAMYGGRFIFIKSTMKTFHKDKGTVQGFMSHRPFLVLHVFLQLLG